MGTRQWRFTLVTVASLLLDPTFADVLVQPGYGQPGNVQKSAAPQIQSPKDQPVGKAPENYTPQQRYPVQQNYQLQQGYPPQQNPTQLLQQQHALQQQYLQYQHQQEHNQLLQLQRQELQNSALRQTGGGEVVGMPYGLPLMRSIVPGSLGGLGGSRLFTLGPLGLNSFTTGGLGGLAPPLLLSPHHQSQMTGSEQFQKSVDGPTQPRARRDTRDVGESSGRKYRKNSRPQQDGVAANSPLKSKPDATAPNAQAGRSNDDTVGSSQNENEENVGSSLLDPLGLVDKAEDIIEDLKSGHLPNPLRGLGHGGHLPGHNSWLNKPNPGERSQFEEHVVGQSQQYQYPQQGRSNEYNANQQRSQIVGDPRHPLHPSFGYPQTYGPFGPAMHYGGYPQTYSSYGPAWMREANSMNNRGNVTPYRGSSIIGAGNPAAQPTTRGNNPSTLSQNPGENSNAYDQVISSQNPATSKAQLQSIQKPADGLGQSSINDRIVGAANTAQATPKQTSWANPGGYNQLVGNPSNQLGGFYQSGGAGQPMLGTLYDPVTGSAEPAALNGGGTPVNYPVGGPGLTPGRNSMVGNPLYNNFYDQNRLNYQYGPNGGWQRHHKSPFGLDELFDDGYNGYHHQHHHHHGGGFNRIYDNVYDDSPYGYGGGHSQYIY